MNLLIENIQLNNLSNYSPEEDFADATCEWSAAVVPAACAGLRLDRALAQMFPEHSRSRLQNWLREGGIRVDGELRDVRAKVFGGERVEINLPEEQTALSAIGENIPLKVMFEDDTLIVIDKPAGLVVHPGNGNASGTLMNALLYHAPALSGVPRAGIVHRLDKDTSGLLVVAKTLEAQTHLVRQLQARSVERRYLALAHGLIARGGEVDAPIGRHPAQRTKMAVVQNGRPALTRYAVLEALPGTTLLECRLATGRTHQIRVHMAHLGHPLVGDPVYGRRHQGIDPRLAGFGRQALHAFRLGLIHPVKGEPMVWKSDLPGDFSELLKGLGSVYQ